MKDPTAEQALERARTLGHRHTHGRALDDTAALALFRACMGREDRPDDDELPDELCAAYEEGVLEQERS